MNKILIGPWVGEFGWEILFAGLMRKKFQNIKNIELYACSFPGNEPFYMDFCDYFIPHDINGGTSCSWSKDGVAINRQQALDLIPTIIQQYNFDEIITPWDDVFEFMFQDKKFNHETPIKSVSDFIPPPITKEIKGYDLIIHARNRGNVSENIPKKEQLIARNYPLESWNQITTELSNMGYSIAAMGNEAYLPDGCVDKRGISLQETINIISSKDTLAVIGVTSGPLHLAMLCKKPIIGWTCLKTFPFGLRLYQEIWNYHNSTQVFMSDMGFNPEPHEIKKWIKLNLGRITNNRNG